MFAKELRRAGHTRTFSIRDAGVSGWEVRDQQDDHVLKHVHYTDWHRVERALHMFNLQIDELEHSGWATDWPQTQATDSGHRFTQMNTDKSTQATDSHR